MIDAATIQLTALEAATVAVPCKGLSYGRACGHEATHMVSFRPWVGDAIPSPRCAAHRRVVGATVVREVAR